MAAETVGRRTLGWRNARVAGLVIVSALLLIFATYRVGKMLDVFADRYEIVTLLPSGLGLRVGAPVTLAGQRVGQVSSIEHIPIDRKIGEANLRVVLAIAEGVQAQIRRDSRAFLRTQGLLGDKFVDIQPGTPGAAILQSGDTIESGESIDMDMMIARVGAAMDNATAVVQNLQEITGGLTRGEGTMGAMLQDPALYANLTATTAELRRTLQEINRSDGTLGRLIRDPTMYNRLSSAVVRVDSLGSMLLYGNGSISRLIREDSIYAGLLGTVGRADSAVAGLSTLVQRAASGDGTLQRFLTDPQLYDEFLKAVIDVQTLIRDIRLNPAKYKPNVQVDIF